ncbi:MAG: hypothetical protein LBF66_02885 [Holosporales bacterium]|jgi:hypothetical protein|nr:hypothetical protein [Holosporales bacterium]
MKKNKEMDRVMLVSALCFAAISVHSSKDICIDSSHLKCREQNPSASKDERLPNPNISHGSPIGPYQVPFGRPSNPVIRADAVIDGGHRLEGVLGIGQNKILP